MFEVLDERPISSWAYPRILVGIPLERAISHADLVFHQFLSIAMNGPAIIKIPYGRVDVVRNAMAMKLLMSQYTHILMLDIDHVHPINIIQQFAAVILQDPEIKVLCGWNYRRGKPYDPIPAVLDEKGRRLMFDEWTEGIAEVDEISGGSLLVHRDVFTQLEPPWFFNVYDEVWQNSWPGEDIGFSRKCRENGIKMYADTRITSPHVTDTLITEATFRKYWNAHKDEEVLVV